MNCAEVEFLMGEFVPTRWNIYRKYETGESHASFDRCVAFRDGTPVGIMLYGRDTVMVWMPGYDETVLFMFKDVLGHFWRDIEYVAGPSDWDPELLRRVAAELSLCVIETK